MPNDSIMVWSSYAEERRSHFTLPPSAMRSYRAYLTYLYTLNHDEAPPDVPDTLEPAEVFINVGRWLWQCASLRRGCPCRAGRAGYLLPVRDGGLADAQVPHQQGVHRRRAAAPTRAARLCTAKELEARMDGCIPSGAH